MFREGLLVVVCGPSGVGKGTILNILKERHSNVRFSVSATTRSPRQGEVDGVSYFFKNLCEFKAMIENHELVEWVEYCGNYYGTPKQYINDSIKEGYDVILEIEVEGAANIKRHYPDSVSVFILPPSFDELTRRIQGRGTEEAAVIEKRLLRAKQELAFVCDYDYVIVNDSIEKAVESLNCILTAEKLKLGRNRGILETIGI